jgi:1-deoxy-D-xylulose-5-phosphate reductoisomerase
MTPTSADPPPRADAAAHAASSPGAAPSGNGAAAPRSVSVLGSTGSIGTQTLDVIRLFPDQFRVRALTAGTNAELLAEQAREFEPDCVAIGDASKAEALREALRPLGITVHVGEEGLCTAARRDDVDVVVAAVVGFAGLEPVLEALKTGATVALANKETLVVGGALVEATLAAHGGTLLPVDSEHSAIFQCLVGEEARTVEQIVLTASGGPFRERDADTFDAITRAEALDHPNWSMGNKITIDSATMMNKGLEVIEAKWLFDLAVDQIEVLVHPQSIVHSMVAFADGAIKAQLGVPDMKVPIQYALSYPARWPAPHERLDWREVPRLDFEPPDLDKFPCLRLAFDAIEAGGTAPAVLNAANEAAVAHFLDEAIAFTDIPRLVEEALARRTPADPTSLEALQAADAEARRCVEELALPTED